MKLFKTTQHRQILRKELSQLQVQKFDFCQSGREPLIEVPGQIQLHNLKTSLTAKNSEVLMTKLGRIQGSFS